MRFYIFVLLFTITFQSCVYDPPQKGSEIIIENQSSRKLYIFDSLPNVETGITLMDTFSVNNRNYIANKTMVVNAFDKYIYFLSDTSVENERNDKVYAKSIFVVGDSAIRQTYTTIIKQNLYKKIDIEFANISKDSANYLFIYPDSIYFTKQYDMNTISNKNKK